MITIVILVGVFIFVYQFRSELGAAYEVTGRAAAPIRSALLPFPKQYKEILTKYFPTTPNLTASNKRHSNKRHCTLFFPRNLFHVSLMWLPMK